MYTCEKRGNRGRDSFELICMKSEKINEKRSSHFFYFLFYLKEAELQF